MSQKSTGEQLKINVSIGDFSPLLRGPGYLFKNLRDTGVNGIELWVGAKSRWTVGYYQRLAEKHGLPIVSLHQPLWAMTGMYFDEGFFALARNLGVQSITCHPLPKVSFRDEQMRAYLKRLADVQTRVGIPVLVENMPQAYRNGLLNHFFPLNKQTTSILDLYKVTSEFGLGMTLDTDHAHVSNPHRQPWFEVILPKLSNIHLSSFTDQRQHMPLYMGELHTEALIIELCRRNYSGLLTLEVGYPKSLTALRYDLHAVKKSVDLIQSVRL